MIVKITSMINVPKLSEGRVNSIAFVFQNIQLEARNLEFFEGSNKRKSGETRE